MLKMKSVLIWCILVGVGMVISGCVAPPPEEEVSTEEEAVVKEEVRGPSVPPGMVLIPAGEFTMGSDVGNNNEEPPHKVHCDAYYIDQYEVTNEQFCTFLNDLGTHQGAGVLWLNLYPKNCLIEHKYREYRPKSGYENHPVIMVTWYGANAYAGWTGKRLPTEAEWEKAARGELVEKSYPWGDEHPEGKCNYLDYHGYLTAKMSDLRDGRGTLTVGSFPSNDYNLYDMAGNISEWCHDWYAADYYADTSSENPLGPENGSFRVVRGGDWNSSIESLRCADRSCKSPDYANIFLGFRCARSAK